MVAEFIKELLLNKQFLSWYLITLKLNQAVETGLQNAQSHTNSTSIELTENSHDSQMQKQQTLPLITSRPISIKEDESSPVDTKPPKSEWVIAIKEKLDQARNDDAADPWAKLSIYRIPQCLRDNDDKAYIPQTVSLGPYHHGERRLRSMDRHKWRALHHVLKRTNQHIELYLEAVKEVEEKARAFYEGPISLGSNEFVEMMVLDACFVLELFQGAATGFTGLGYSRSDPIFAMRGAMHSIQRDMIMLENQIPLLILDRLYGIQCGNPDQNGEVARLALQFFDSLMPTDEPDEPLSKSDRSKLESLTEQGGLHCLEVFRRSLLAIRAGPKPTPTPRVWIRVWIKRWFHTSRVADKRWQQLIHCATDLKDAGIKFKRRKTDRFWDIKFENGVLKIPRLLIHDGTKSLFLNLIAFEQCHLDCTNDINSYVTFMDSLIDSPGDVSYLHYCGIIENWLGSDAEVSEMFNRLGQEVGFDIDDSYLSLLFEQVNRYYDHRWNAWRASLKHKYFNNPWSIISFLAAVVLLALTLAQTFYTVYAYYAPPS